MDCQKKIQEMEGITGGSCLHLDLYIMSQPMESFCSRKDMKDVEDSLINQLIIALRCAVENNVSVLMHIYLAEDIRLSFPLRVMLVYL